MEERKKEERKTALEETKAVEEEKQLQVAHEPINIMELFQEKEDLLTLLQKDKDFYES